MPPAIPCGTAAATIPNSSLVGTGESPPGPFPPDCRAGFPEASSEPSGLPAKAPLRDPSGNRAGPATGFRLSEISAPAADGALPDPLISGAGATGSAPGIAAEELGLL